MATVTKAANAHTAVSTGFTNPSNAYATTGDNVYATAPLPSTQNSTVSGDFGFPSFSADIPAYSTINSLTLNTEYSLSATVTGLTSGIQIHRPGGTGFGTEVTRSTLTEATATQSYTVPGANSDTWLADLRGTTPTTVGRVRITKGNTTNLSTLSLDYISLTVDYTAPSTVTTLSNLTFTAGTLSPSFSSGTSSYSFTSPYATTTTTFTATATGPTTGGFAMEYRVGGSGSWTTLSHTNGVATSPSISLNVGSNTVEIRVRAQDGVTYTASPYTVTITRTAASTDADLIAMEFSGVTISPSFSNSTITYTGTTSYATASTTLSATRSSALATALEYQLNGGSWTSFATSGNASLALNVWSNTVGVRVTAESGATKTYTTTITRVGPYDFGGTLTVDDEEVSLNTHTHSSLTSATLTTPTITQGIGTPAFSSNSYTLSIGDAGLLLLASNSTTAGNVKIPTNASVAFPVGTQIHIIQTGSGQLTISATTSGTTSVLSVGATAASPKLRVQYSTATMLKTATDTWYVFGDIS